jgi:hypothetical protein
MNFAFSVFKISIVLGQTPKKVLSEGATGVRFVPRRHHLYISADSSYWTVGGRM